MLHNLVEWTVRIRSRVPHNTDILPEKEMAGRIYDSRLLITRMNMTGAGDERCDFKMELVKKS